MITKQQVMKRLNLIAVIFTALLVATSFSTATAQDEMPPENAAKQDLNGQRRPNLLAELDLTTEQIQQIRRINADKKSLRREAQLKVREANRALDQAIYADRADETEIQTRLKDLQTAQAEVSKIRSMIEYAVRNVLTPAQLVKFREVRQSFVENMENRFNRPRSRSLNNQNQRFINRQRRLRPNK